MDKAPRIVEDASAPITPQMQALIDDVTDAKDAMDLANHAPAVEIEVDGQMVKHLNIRLSAQETRRVMSLPVEERAAMATHIIKERKLASHLRRVDEKATVIVKRDAKTKRRAKAKARRRNR